MKRALTGYAAVCLLAGSLLYTSTAPGFAASAQSAGRAVQDAPHTPSRTKPAETHQTPIKSTSEVSVARATPKKDASGKRFWSRIMNHFREINSAEKKPN